MHIVVRLLQIVVPYTIIDIDAYLFFVVTTWQIVVFYIHSNSISM